MTHGIITAKEKKQGDCYEDIQKIFVIDHGALPEHLHAGRL